MYKLYAIGVIQIDFGIKSLAEVQYATDLGNKFATERPFATVLYIKLAYKALFAQHLTIRF